MTNKVTFPQDAKSFQQFLDCIISPVAYLDKEFNFIMVNQAYANADNRDSKFFPGKNHFDLYPNPENEQIFQSVIRTGKSYKCIARPFEYEDHPERNTSYWDWELNLIKDDEDNLQGLMLSLSDVTERIIIEEEQFHNLLIQEIVASILKLSLQPLPFNEFLRQALVFALQANKLELAPKGVIFLLNPETDELEMTVRHGLPESIISSCAKIRRGQCICGMALEQEKIVFTSCVDEHHHVTYPGMSSHGHYCVPIKFQGEILGVLNLYVEHGHHSNRIEEQFVTTIADTLASTIIRERTSRSLKESEQRFRTITETARDAIISINLKGEIISWNIGAKSLFGYTYEEIISQPVTKIMPERFHKKHNKALKQWRISGESQHANSPMEVLGLRNDGIEIPLEILLSSWNFKDCTHITGIVRDISRRRKDEIELRLAKAVFNNAMEGIIVTDTDTHIVSVNQAVTEITGYKEEELIGQTPNIWKSNYHDALFFHSIWLKIKQYGEWRGEIWNRHKNGKVFPCWQTIRVIKDSTEDITNYISIMSDISSIKASQEKIDYLAYHDPLTGLPNRILFHERLEHALKRAQREQHMVAVLFLDLDKFKYINDSLGHSVGDMVLQEVAKRLQETIREEDTVARIGGDEFPILLEHINDSSEATIVAAKLLTVFSEPFEISPHKLHLGPSIGISLYPLDAKDCATLLRDADTAMYKAKAEGGNTYHFYTEEMTRKAIERIIMENNLRQALDNEDFIVYYQPQVDGESGQLIGMEALIRWKHETMGMISPAKFIPLAEETGLIVLLDQWTMRTAMLQLVKWYKKGHNPGILALNLAMKQLHQKGFIDLLATMLKETECQPEWLELEVTEGQIMIDPDNAITILEQISSMGIELAIDDFGTGYSSLSYLKRLPINKLKIDQSFVKHLPDDLNDAAITRSVISLAQNLNLKIIAEGVETEAQKAFLVENGCRNIQGYFYAKPMPIDKMEVYLNK